MSRLRRIISVNQFHHPPNPVVHTSCGYVPRIMTSSSSLNVIGIEDGMFMGEAPGFGGCIKQVAADFWVSGIHSLCCIVNLTAVFM